MMKKKMFEIMDSDELYLLEVAIGSYRDKALDIAETLDYRWRRKKNESENKDLIEIDRHMVELQTRYAKKIIYMADRIEIIRKAHDNEEL